MTFKIGPHTFPNPWILAPMAGVSERPFRVLARRFGAGAAPTELVSAKGLLYGQDRTARYMDHDPVVESPFWAQLFGGDADSMAAGAERAAELGADIIDINMGCPVKKVTRNGAGSALLCEPERARDIVAEIIKRTGLPVTVKIRAGWDAHTINFKDVCSAVTDGGASAIAMHARTRAQAYSGQADWSLIRALVEHASIPVIGNGDAFDAQSARRMKLETGCQAVMIGRGAMGNPWVFAQCLDRSVSRPSGDQLWETVYAHWCAHRDFVDNEVKAIRRFRPHWLWYAHGLVNARSFREQVTKIDEVEPMLELCHRFYTTARRAEQGSGAREFDTRKALG